MPRAVNEHEAGETNSATGVGGAVIFEGECVVRGTGLVGVAVGEAVGVSETNATKGMGGGRAALPVSISKRESVSPPAPFASFARAASPSALLRRNASRRTCPKQQLRIRRGAVPDIAP
jgi:hypothetical protein